jgi:membrane protein required for colicin V production
MTGFDIAVLVLVGFCAIIGFSRGFVQEILALAAWAFSLVAIHYAHTAVTRSLAVNFAGHLGPGAASVLAFAFLLLTPYIVIRLIASRLGAASRDSFLGPVDRVIGFGFGTVKGILLAVLAFSIIALAYDTAWGVGGRPDWITRSRAYPFINACSDALVKMIGERRNSAASAESRRLSKKK